MVIKENNKKIKQTNKIPVWANIHRVPSEGVFGRPICEPFMMLAGQDNISTKTSGYNYRSRLYDNESIMSVRVG